MFVDPHHCIPAQKLRALVDSRAYHERLSPAEKDALMAATVFDLRNRQWLCRKRHAEHHGNRPIAYALLPEPAVEFARELDLVRYLEAEYA